MSEGVAVTGLELATRSVPRAAIAALFVVFASSCAGPSPEETAGVGVAQVGTDDPAWRCYDPEPGHPTAAEQRSFITANAAAAQEAERIYGVPAAGLLGIAAEEGGYGFTRVAQFAQNSFGYKWASTRGAGGRSAYALECQPESDPNNLYVTFGSIREGFAFVAAKLASRDEAWANFKAVTDAYRSSRAMGQDVVAAVDAWVEGIAYAGYNPGSGPYAQKVLNHTRRLNLYQYSLTVAPGREATMPPPEEATPAGPPAQPPPAAPAAWIAIDEPAEGARVAGDVPLRTTVPSGVTHVRFVSINSNGYEYVIGSAGPPFDRSWSTAGWVSNGSYTLRFEAWSGETQVASASRRVVVAN